LGWHLPTYAHIPLIHGSDGSKLSKRHGALGVEAYRNMGYLPETLRNYLLRLGWSHGDDEIISTEQAVSWFDFGGLGKSPSRLDLAKLGNLNGHYLREAEDDRLAGLMAPFLADQLSRALTQDDQSRLIEALPGLKQRSKTLPELIENSAFYFSDGAPAPDEKAAKLLTVDAVADLKRLSEELREVLDWTSDSLQDVVRDFAEADQLKLGKVAQPLRAALTGRTVSPGVFDVMRVLGRDETIRRLLDASPTG